MTDRHPSQLDRLEARIDAHARRIDELYRLLHDASPDGRRIAQPTRRPRRRRDRVAARP